MSSINLIVGLGNPGKQYENTRHNVGFWFIDKICQKYNTPLKAETKFLGHVCRIQHSNSDFWLLKPTTFINLSGNSIQAFTKFYKINTENILIVNDELDLPTGTIRLKTGGGHGGHNGLRDTINKLSSNKFHRLRIGISHPRESTHKTYKDVADYVLSAPSNSDSLQIKLALDEAITYMNDLLQGNFAKIMQELHSK